MLACGIQYPNLSAQYLSMKLSEVFHVLLDCINWFWEWDSNPLTNSRRVTDIDKCDNQGAFKGCGHVMSMDKNYNSHNF